VRRRGKEVDGVSVELEKNSFSTALRVVLRRRERKKKGFKLFSQKKRKVNKILKVFVGNVR
jgi:hypothetical protein